MSDSIRGLAHRAPVLWLLLPWMAGVIGSREWPFAWKLGGAMWGSVGLAVGLVATQRWLRPCVWGVGLVLAVGLAGVVRGVQAQNRLPAWEGRPPREARLTLNVGRLFTAGADPRKVSGLATVEKASGAMRGVVGQTIYFSARLGKGGLAHRPNRSSVLECVGQWETLPREPAPASFEAYLVTAGVNFKLTRGRLGQTVREPTAYWRWCARLHDRMAAVLGYGLEAHPELSGSLRAMMLGELQAMSEERKTDYTQCGTLHLFSISGLHIGVIAVTLGGLLKWVRLPGMVRFLLTAGLIWLYVDINGRAPSAVRAFVMFGLVEGARVFWRPRSVVSALMVSALLVLLVDPLQLFSASFQMSYGIMAALLLLGVPLGETCQQTWQVFAWLPPASWARWQRVVAQVWRKGLLNVAVALATALVGFVTGVIYFGLLTPGAFFANFVMIPAASLALLAGVASLLTGLAGLDALAVLFNHAAALLFKLMNAVTAAWVNVEGVYWPAQFLRPWLGGAVLAVLMALLLWGFATRWTLKRGGFGLPFAFTAAALILLVTFSPRR